MGTRVYLSCTTTEELVRGHCIIVPIQHHLNMLEGDDDVWDETRVSPDLVCFYSILSFPIEFYEMPYAHERRGGQRGCLFRNRFVFEEAETYLH